MNLLNKTLLASGMLAASMSVNASPFYVDLFGTGVGFGAADATNCATCTGDKTEIDYSYSSSTTITLGTANSIAVGDVINTTGGLNVGDLNSYATNRFSGFLPGTFSRGFTNDPTSATSSNWGLSLAFNLTGAIDALAAPNVVSEVKYTGGLVEIFLIKFDGLGNVSSATNIFDVTVTGSDNSNGSNFLVLGDVSFNGNESYTNMFHSDTFACAGDNSFFALASCVPPVKVAATFDQNLNNATADKIDDFHYKIAGDHNGSLSFNVPEPSTLMLLGGALLGLSATRRNKA